MKNWPMERSELCDPLFNLKFVWHAWDAGVGGGAPTGVDADGSGGGVATYRDR